MLIMRHRRHVITVIQVFCMKKKTQGNCWDLFIHASSSDLVMFYAGILLTVVVGASFPVSIMIFRWVVNDFMNPLGVSYGKIYITSAWFAAVAASTFITSLAQVWCTNTSSSRQVKHIRQLLIQAILSQEVAWIDKQNIGGLIDKLTEHTTNIRLGVGEKLNEFIQNISSFFFGLCIAFTCGWKLTLVACATLPLVLIGFSLFGIVVRKFTQKEKDAYSKSSAVAEEVLSAIRTVISFGGESKEILRYSKTLDDTTVCGVKQAGYLGFAGGFVGMSVYTSAALVFWYGVTLIRQDEYDPGSVILVFLNVIIGSLFLGSALPNFRYFHLAKASAQDIFHIIERKRSVDKASSGKQLDDFSGKITFNNVTFSYPSRCEKVVLKNLNLTLESKQTTAFIGPSGCGKTTITQLIERFYNPDSGQILFDDTDICSLDINWLRSLIGVVQQEPVLFSGTISDNIRMGYLKDAVCDDDIVEAAKLANAHEFIIKLPKGYNTMVSHVGVELSVGQKQRISIARALIRRPKILILDEATSALDNHSEKMIQSALEDIKINRTVIIIAHRLSTIRNADKIVALKDGYIIQTGTHTELSTISGFYSAMLKLEIPETNTPFISENGSILQTADNNKFFTENVASDLDHIQNKTKIDIHLKGNETEYEVNKDEVTLNMSGSTDVRIKTGLGSSMIRLLKVSRPEWKSLTFGCIAASITGGIQPVFAVLYSEMYAIFHSAQKPVEMQTRANLVTGVIAALGLIRLVSSTFQGYFLGVSGQKLTRRLRENLFASMLRQEMAWHDRPENHPPSLLVMLTSDANKVNTLCGTSLGRLIESIVLVLISLTIGLVYNWKLTLVVFFFFPVIMLSGYLQLRQIRKGSSGNKESMAARVIYEALCSTRTVHAYSLENYFYKQYCSILSSEMAAENRAFVMYALVYALAQSLPICSYAAAFSCGAYLMSIGEINLIAIFRVFAAISFAAQALGRTSHIGPELKHASLAADRIFRLLDRKSNIPVNEGLCLEQPINEIPIEFRKVSFRYPSRPESWILKDFSYTFRPGHKTAIVGLSGSGKTSILSLIQRLYDDERGNSNCGIFFNGVNSRLISPKWIRQQICVVTQEPQLFNLSLMENIAYGDNAQSVTMDEITNAARLANIHEFIMGLPQGYKTLAGPRGMHISTGQKQKLAIARSLIRKPKLLLLDEITSALDLQNEQSIQNMLVSLPQDCAYLMVTHRLLTTTQVDDILVLARGKIIETGTFHQLKQTRGAFFALFCSE
ncbi:unnamed protein product [Heterobilharzia americana]|nr:unnamed protein product [Heterobilharzia americana]